MIISSFKLGMNSSISVYQIYFWQEKKKDDIAIFVLFAT